MRTLSFAALAVFVAVAAAPTASSAAPPQRIDSVNDRPPVAPRQAVLTPAPSVTQVLRLTAPLTQDSLQLVRATLPPAERTALSVAMATLGKLRDTLYSTNALPRARGATDRYSLQVASRPSNRL